MVAAVVPFVLAMLFAAVLLTLYRLVRGPGMADRILSLDTLYINAIAIIMVLGIFFDTDVYFEAALLIAMLGFVGTCALAKFVLRGDIME
jgi:multicomponent K+:H+ antiporter subunit F